SCLKSYSAPNVASSQTFATKSAKLWCCGAHNSTLTRWPLMDGPRGYTPRMSRGVAPPLRLLRHWGRSVYARPRVTPIGRTDMSTMRIMTAAALAAVFAVSTASAQQPTTQRVAGTLDKVEGNTLYIKAASGPVVLKLADNALVVARIKASAADIKAGDYVAHRGAPQPHGTQKAGEPPIFPESKRGNGDGH